MNNFFFFFCFFWKYISRDFSKLYMCGFLINAITEYHKNLYIGLCKCLRKQEFLEYCRIIRERERDSICGYRCLNKTKVEKEEKKLLYSCAHTCLHLIVSIAENKWAKIDSITLRLSSNMEIIINRKTVTKHDEKMKKKKTRKESKSRWIRQQPIWLIFA